MEEVTQLDKHDFDPGLYPRTYRLTKKSRNQYFLYAFAAMLFSAASYFYAHTDFLVMPVTKGSAEVLAIFGVFFCVFFLICPFGTKLELTSESITSYRFFIPRRLMRDDIVGLEKSRFLLWDDTTSLVANDGNGRFGPDMFLSSMEVDEALNRWIYSLPNFKDVRRAFADEHIKWGTSPESRYRAYMALKYVLGYGSLFILFIVFFLHDRLSPSMVPDLKPAIVTILYAIPFLAFFLRLKAPQIFNAGVFNRTEQLKISVGALVIFPGILLLFWMFKLCQKHGMWPDNYGFYSVQFWALFLLLFLMSGVHYNFKKFHIFLLEVLGGLYFTGLAALGFAHSYNMLFDNAAPAYEKATIIKKRPVEKAEENSARWLEVNFYQGEEDKSNALSASYQLYDAVNTGELVCEYSYKGAAGIPWTKADRCPQ